MRLRLPFEVEAPHVDETAHAGETPLQTALRLARAKALAVAQRHSDAVVIGSDQVAELDGEAIGKPLRHDVALAQLRRMQGRAVVFHTALAVACGADERVLVDDVPTTVRFRRHDDAALETYLQLDRPYDCAGAAKIESLGVALLEAVESTDPTALIGLPLIRLTSMLEQFGVAVLAPRI